MNLDFFINLSKECGSSKNYTEKTDHQIIFWFVGKCFELSGHLAATVRDLHLESRLSPEWIVLHNESTSVLKTNAENIMLKKLWNFSMSYENESKSWSIFKGCQTFKL